MKNKNIFQKISRCKREDIVVAVRSIWRFAGYCFFCISECGELVVWVKKSMYCDCSDCYQKAI